MLQHTPNVEKSFSSLIPFLKHEGHIATDVYSKHNLSAVRSMKYKIHRYVRKICYPLLYIMLKLAFPVGLKLMTDKHWSTQVGKKTTTYYDNPKERCLSDFS